LSKRSFIGAGAVVTAAFIGPGTVTTCVTAGVNNGYTLLWALLFATICTIILQEVVLNMTLQEGITVEKIIANSIGNSAIKSAILAMLILAIIFGNSAYQAGNITGTALGISVMAGQESMKTILIVVGLIIVGILSLSNTKALQNFLTAIVLLMTLAFLFALLSVKLELLGVIKGLITPNMGSNDFKTILGLVGTTVVPYNLFLYSHLLLGNQNSTIDQKMLKRDLYISIGLGGLISIAIVIVAASQQGAEIKSGVDLALSLQPIYGDFAKYLIGFGLFAAGFTSAITAPMAAGLLASSLLPSIKFSKLAIMLLVFCIGFYFAYQSQKPIQLILVAQYLNGVILPLVSLLIVVFAFKRIPEIYNLKNLRGWLVIIVWLVTLFLGINALKIF
jgi:manganese transport protein